MITEECPICMESRQLIKPSCNHGICQQCIGYMCSSKFNFEKKCPICRKIYFDFEIEQYSKFCTIYDENIANNLKKQILKLISKNPDFIDPISFLSTKVSNDELNQQVSAINDFNSGKMSYAEMRAIAG